MRYQQVYTLVAAVLLAPQPVLAQTSRSVAESDWLELVKGHRGTTLGAEMREVDTDSSPGYRRLTVAIPKDAIDHPDGIEEVLVVGRKPEESEPIIDLDYEYEWLDNYDEDNYGLVIRLSEDSNWPIRLFMRSQEGYIRQLPADDRLEQP